MSDEREHEQTLDRLALRIEVSRSQLRALAHDLVRESEGDVGELRAALEESVRLMAHYAKLLNMYDRGERMIFPTVDAWLARLRELAQGKV